MTRICQTDEDHRDYPEGSNRRGSCVRCGRPIPEIPPPPKSARNPVYEERFFDEVMGLAVKLGHVSPSFITAARERLSVGADRYGDDAFMRRDNLEALSEEPPDIPGYSVLDLQKTLWERGEDDLYLADHLDLVGASAHAAISHELVQRVRRRRAGLED